MLENAVEIVQYSSHEGKVYETLANFDREVWQDGMSQTIPNMFEKLNVKKPRPVVKEDSRQFENLRWP